MKVVCKYLRVEDLPKGARKDYLTKNSDIVALPDELKVGKIYTVYALNMSSNDSYYWVYEEERNEKCPYSYNSDFFDIVDRKISSFWRIKIGLIGEQDELTTELAYPEWFDNPMHCEDLIDGDPEEEKIFWHYKELMDKEFD